MKELPGQPERNKNPESVSEVLLWKQSRQESEHLSRFGGRAGKIARILMLATVLGGGIAYRADIVREGEKIVQSVKDHNAEQEKRFTPHEGAGRVVKKDVRYYTQPGMIFGGGRAGSPVMGMPSQEMEKYIVTVSINGTELDGEVSKEDFEKYKTGDNVKVRYIEPSPNEKTITSINLEEPPAAQNK